MTKDLAGRNSSLRGSFITPLSEDDKLFAVGFVNMIYFWNWNIIFIIKHNELAVCFINQLHIAGFYSIRSRRDSVWLVSGSKSGQIAAD